MTEMNYVRNLSGDGPADRPKPAPRPGPPVPPVPFVLVVPGVLSWLAPTLPRVRYKILPAWVLGGESGTKLSLRA